MDIGEIAKKVDALEAELIAKLSRIADLEAKVSLLEAERTRLRKGVAVDVNRGESADGGVPAVPTPMKCEAGGGVGGDHGDDEFPVIQRRKKRKSAQMVSDSESVDEDENGEGYGNEEVGVPSSRKREHDTGDVHAVSPKHVPCVAETGIGNEEGDEDDKKTIGEVIRKMREERRSRDDGGLCETKGFSTPGNSPSAPLVKSQSKRRPARRALEFVEPKDFEESEEDGPEDDDSISEFIDDADCSENSSDFAELEESDNEENYEEIMDRIRGKKNADNKDWETEGEMLSAFDKHPELTLKAVCALYRKQTEEEQAEKATIVHNKRGFSQIHARRGSYIAQFLLDGDASGPLKKTAQDLEKYDRYGLEFCLKMAFHYSKQLFEIYKNKEDPYFP